MENVVFIGQDFVRVIRGEYKKEEFKVNYFESFPLPEECMLNGMIADENALISVLDKLQAADIKSARLVISSNSMVLKNVKVPKLTKAQLMEYTREEILSAQEEGEEKEFVYDYGVLNDEDGTGGEILCCGMERSILASYIEAFEKVKIKLLSIDISIFALCKLTKNIPILDGKNYILSSIDGNHIVTTIFVNNQYTFTNRVRLFAERESDEFVQEITRSISQIIQFSKAQLHDVEFDSLYITGLQGEEKKAYVQVKTLFSLDAKVFPAVDCIKVLGVPNKEEINNYLFCVGSLVRK